MGRKIVQAAEISGDMSYTPVTIATSGFILSEYGHITAIIAIAVSLGVGCLTNMCYSDLNIDC